jgi:hypothetical protein
MVQQYLLMNSLVMGFSISVSALLVGCESSPKTDGVFVTTTRFGD